MADEMWVRMLSDDGHDDPKRALHIHVIRRYTGHTDWFTHFHVTTSFQDWKLRAVATTVQYKNRTETPSMLWGVDAKTGNATRLRWFRP